jgi:hypothetical protein
MRLFIVLLLSSLFSFSATAGTSAWELEEEEKDINLKIFTREVEGSNLREFKGEMLINTQMSTIAALLLDSKSAPKWMHQCVKFEVIDQVDPLTAIVYFINGAPWPVSDRDAVVKSVMSQDPESLILKVEISVVDGLVPEDDDYVRIPNMNGFWLFEPKEAGQILVTYQVHANPGGSLPDWLANSVVVETPYNTMSNMAEMLKLDKYTQAELPMIKNVQ